MATYSPSKITKDGNTYNFTDTTKIPLAGTNALSGSIVPDTDNAYNLGDSTYGFASFYVNKIYLKGSTIFNLVDDNYICVGGATAQANGANLVLNGKNRSTSTGEFKLEARDGANTKQLIGKPDGTLSWNNKNLAMAEDVMPRSGGAVIAGQRLSRTVDNDQLNIDGGSGGNGGSSIALYGKDIDYLNSGGCTIVTHKTSTYLMNIFSSGSWTWTGQAVQLISDQRYKQQINAIDDKLLDAWESVELCQFKYNDAVNEKGDNARLHTGYVVQQIDNACKSHGVDISEYGLYCHEEYPQETEEVEHEGGTKTIEVVRPANEHYSLRYTEALIVECAYLRKCIKELRNEIERLKSSK